MSPNDDLQLEQCAWSQCTNPLDAESPSGLFCSDVCQRLWGEAHDRSLDDQARLERESLTQGDRRAELELRRLFGQSA